MAVRRKDREMINRVKQVIMITMEGSMDNKPINSMISRLCT
jgi:hypothetical protein